MARDRKKPRRRVRWRWEYTGRAAEEVWDLLLERGAVCRYIYPGLRMEAVAQEFEELLDDEESYWAGAWIRGEHVASALFPARGEDPVFVETYDPPPRR